MKTQIHAVHFHADKKLNEFIKTKLNKLETFYNNIIDAEVFLKLDAQENNENKIVELKVNIPGEHFFVKENSHKFEIAVETAVKVMKRRLKRFKEKHFNHKNKTFKDENLTTNKEADGNDFDELDDI